MPLYYVNKYDQLLIIQIKALYDFECVCLCVDCRGPQDGAADQRRLKDKLCLLYSTEDVMEQNTLTTTKIIFMLSSSAFRTLFLVRLSNAKCWCHWAKRIIVITVIIHK